MDSITLQHITVHIEEQHKDALAQINGLIADIAICDDIKEPMRNELNERLTGLSKTVQNITKIPL